MQVYEEVYQTTSCLIDRLVTDFFALHETWRLPFRNNR